jgi:hypothetical protein
VRLLVILTIAACARSNDVAPLQFEASVIAAVNQPKLDALVVRVHDLRRRLRGELPGWQNMFRTAQLANDELGLPPFEQTTPPGPEWRSSSTTLLGMGAYVRSRAAELATQHRRDELRFLVDDERARYDRGIASVTEHLEQVERWLAASRSLRVSRASSGSGSG